MKKTLITTAALASLAVFMMATGPQGDPLQDQIDKLRVEMANQSLRIDTLEHAAGQTPAAHRTGSSDSAASGKPVRTMVLVSINEFDHSGDHSEEIARLKRQCASLMNTVNAAADQAAADSGQQIYAAHVRGGCRGWGGAAGGGIATSNAGAVGRQVMADHQVENRYATIRAIKKQKLEALQRATAEPRQIIMGHDGNMIISLETKHNLTESLDNIKIGDAVTWTGQRVSADDSSEDWTISTIKAAR